jgi:acyl-CoA thioester hydrolase
MARTALSGFDVPSRTRRPLSNDVIEVFAAMVETAELLRPIVWRDMTEKAKISEMRVRWSDIDSYGHVNNAMIFDYLQEGRITFTAAPLRGTGETADLEHMWFLARQDVWYRNAVVFRKEPYVVRTGIAHAGNTSVTFSSQVDDPLTGTVCACASAVAVFADATGRPTPLTPEIRESLEQFSLSA